MTYMKSPVILVVLLLIGLGAGFFAGMQYQKNQIRPGFNNQQARVRFGDRNMIGARPVAGEIISTDDQSITVKLQDGSSKIVLVPSSTQINKAAVASKIDLKAGEKVAVFGTQNTDGSVTAQNIQLSPETRVFGSPSASPR